MIRENIIKNIWSISLFCLYVCIYVIRFSFHVFTNKLQIYIIIVPVFNEIIGFIVRSEDIIYIEI